MSMLSARFFLIFPLLFVSTLSQAQTGPWAKYDDKMKGEALVREADGGYLNEVKSIMEGGGNVNYQLQPSGLTPLMAAASNNRAEVVDFLLHHGANVNLKDANGKTGYDRATAFFAAEALKVFNEYSGKSKPTTPTPAPPTVPAAPAEQTNAIDVPAQTSANNAGSKGWPELGTYKENDSVMYFAGSWKRGTIKQVGLTANLNNKYASPGELKYLIAPDAYANWPDWTDWSRVSGLKREHFWTAWFIGKWELGEVMAVNTRKEGNYERTEVGYAAASENLQLNVDGNYVWTVDKKNKITGKWQPATDGPGIVLRHAKKGLDWTIHNETTASELHIRKLEKARLTPSSSGVMSIAAKRAANL